MKTSTQRPHASPIALLEFQTAALRVDRQAGVIRGVKILGYESKNGRSYSRRAVAKAKPLYEGKRVNIDHPPAHDPQQPRKMADRFGYLKNVSEQADGLYGDLHYLKSHALADQTAEAAERMPHVLGLSHNSTGRVVERGGKTIVEEILAVRSVDLVGDPATNQSLFEGSDCMTTPMSGEPTDDVAGEDGAADFDGSPDQQTMAAFRARIVAVLDDDSLDARTTIKRLAAILRSLEKSLTKTMTKPDETAPAIARAADADTVEGEWGAAAPEIAELQEQLRRLKAQGEARELLDAAGVRPTAILLESLAALPSAEKRRALVESLVESLGGATTSAGGAGRARGEPRSVKPQPRSAKPLMESFGSGAGFGGGFGSGLRGTSKMPQFKTPAERAAFLRSGRLPAAG